MEAREWVLTDGALVNVTPHLHADQHDPDVQWPVKLMTQMSSLGHINENLTRRGRKIGTV